MPLLLKELELFMLHWNTATVSTHHQQNWQISYIPIRGNNPSVFIAKKHKQCFALFCTSLGIFCLTFFSYFLKYGFTLFITANIRFLSERSLGTLFLMKILSKLNTKSKNQKLQQNSTLEKNVHTVSVRLKYSEITDFSSGELISAGNSRWELTQTFSLAQIPHQLCLGDEWWWYFCYRSLTLRFSLSKVPSSYK